MNGAVNYIAIILIVIVIGAAVAYIIKEKKRGKKCVGCPYGSSCGKKDCSSHGCNLKEKDQSSK